MRTHGTRALSAHCLFLPLCLAAAPLAGQQLRELESEQVPDGRIEPTAMVHGDLDGDGDLDLVIAQNPRQTFDGSERVWLNDGHGRFEDASNRLGTPSNSFTQGLALGDVDGDGDLDLLTLGNSNQLWINDGSARFSDQTTRLPAEGRSDAKVGLLADFDRDGDLDLVLAGVHRDAYLENTGGGNFTFRRPLPFARSSSGLRLGPFSAWAGKAVDLTGDGNLDVFMTQPFVLFAGDGRGNFAEVQHGIPPSLCAEQDLAVADIDNDGDLDVAAALWGNPSLQPVRAMLLANQGNGTFVETTASAMPNNHNAHAVAFVDLDGDGVLDLVVGQDVAPVVLLGNGAGAFTPAPPTLQVDGSASNIAILGADLDGDGRNDLACASVRRGPGPSYHGRVEVHANTGGALALVSPPRIPRFPTVTSKLALMDVDADGDLDIWRGTSGDSPLLINDGSGFFAPASGQQLGIQTFLGVGAVAAGDYDRDGDLDAFVGLANGAGVLLDNLGAARFAARGIAIGANGFGDAAFADLNGDGNLDLFVAGTRQAELWLGDGTGNFMPASGTLPPASLIADLEVGDVDGDGDLDVLLGNLLPLAPSQVQLLLNDGTGGFTAAPASSLTAATTAREAKFFDWDGDGDLDVVLAGARVELHENVGSARFRDITATAIPVGLDTPLAVHVADLDGDGVAEVLVGRAAGNRCLRRQGAAFVVAGALLPDDGHGAAFATGDLDRDGDVDAYVGRIYGGIGIVDLLYFNLDHQLQAPVEPRLGRPYRLRLDRWRGNAIGAAAAFPFCALGTLAPRIPLPPFGDVGLDLRSLIALPAVAIPAPSGTVNVAMTLPRVAALHGLPFSAQALVAPGGHVAEWRFTGVTQQRLLR